MTFVVLSAVGCRSHPLAALALAKEAFERGDSTTVVITCADIVGSGSVEPQNASLEHFSRIELSNLFLGSELDFNQVHLIAMEAASVGPALIIDGGGDTLTRIRRVLKHLSKVALDHRVTHLAIAVDDRQLLSVAELVETLFFVEPLSLQVYPADRISRHIRLRGVLMRFATLHVLWRGLSKLMGRGRGLKGK